MAGYETIKKMNRKNLRTVVDCTQGKPQARTGNRLQYQGTDSLVTLLISEFHKGTLLYLTTDSRQGNTSHFATIPSSFKLSSTGSRSLYCSRQYYFNHHI